MDITKTELFTQQDLEEMAQTDPRTVDKDTLVDIADISVDRDLPKEERMMDFMEQIKNPYCYLDNGIVVKISFSGKSTLEQCIQDSAF